MQKYLTIEIQDVEKNPIRLSITGTRLLVRDAPGVFMISLPELKDALQALEEFQKLEGHGLTDETESQSN